MSLVGCVWHVSCPIGVCEDSSYCSGHGTCNAEEGGCTCDYEWVGDRCDRPRTLCDPDPCNGHGTCNITDGSCECNLGWRPDPGTPSDCRYEYEGKWCGSCDPTEPNQNTQRLRLLNDAGLMLCSVVKTVHM